MSIKPFNKLVKLTARAFYDDISTKGSNQPKTSRGDNRGLAVVILDTLTTHQWVREEDLAKDLRIHLKQLRRTLRFFEEEKLVMRDHRKETAKGVRLHAAAIAATAHNQHPSREGEEKIKLHTHSYCCLDYAQIYDVVRYRMHRMKKKLKDELESKNTIQEYICPNCNERYTALDAARLASMDDEYFHCESCNGELVAKIDKLAAPELGYADDNARRRRREKLKEMLQKIEVEVAFSGVQAKEEDSKSTSSNTPLKVLPSWMIKQGMNLTKEQRGEVEEEIKMDGSSASAGLSDDKKSNFDKDTKNLQDEYLKAYYAALFERQRQQEEAAKKEQELSNGQISDQGTPSDRQVGMKSKCEVDDEDDVEWEEAASSGNTGESYKVSDLNVEADATAKDDDDDVEWEEG